MAQKEEITLRKKAVCLHAQGKSITEISRFLGRSRQWVYKWIGRHESGSSDWSKSLSNAPVHSSCKTDDDLEQAVIETRLRLVKNPYMESGAYAIFHDMVKRGISSPSVSTINRILKKHGLVRKRVPYQKSGIEYPEIPFNTHLMDLVGPCYLKGGQSYYILDIISNETRHAGVFPILSKSARNVTASVVRFWQDYSLPTFLQIDNELSFKGSNRYPKSLGLLIRTLLDIGVTPIFIPVGEPWRNGVVEKFNQKVERTLLMEPHKDFEELTRCATAFSMVHNSEHHYSTLGHKTPEQLETERGMEPCPLSRDYTVGKRPPLSSLNKNEIIFIKLVRSNLIVEVLNAKIKLDSSLMHTYVEAIVSINKQCLLIRQDGEIKQRFKFPMPVI